MEKSESKPEIEISLRDLIETFFKGKIIIAIVTITAILLSGLASFVLLPEVYESRAVLMANPIDLNSVSTDSNSQLIEYLTKLPTITMQTYMEQVVTVEVLNDTIVTLDLRDSNNQYISAASLRSMLSVTNINGTNLIEIIARNGNPEMAANIVNTLANSFIKYVADNTRSLGQQAVEKIGQQLATEEENLNEKTKTLADFWKSNTDTDVLKGEVELTTKKIVEIRSQLSDLASEIDANQSSLATLAAEIQKTPGLESTDFKINLNLINPNNVQDVEINLASDDLSIALLRIEINRLQTNLINAISKKDALENQVSLHEENLVNDKIKLTEAEYKYNSLNRELQLAQQAYDAYQQKYKEAMLAVASDIGETSVIVTSSGSIPVSPVEPNKIMNILLSAVFGLILGIFIVFFRDYWRKSKPATLTGSTAKT